jgi:uncharacterized protein (TIGR02001 family)
LATLVRGLPQKAAVSIDNTDLSWRKEKMKFAKSFVSSQAHAIARLTILLPLTPNIQFAGFTAPPSWAPSPDSPKIAVQPLKRGLRACLAASAVALSGLIMPATALAQAKSDPAFTLTGNAAIVSDYRYRGLTQTRFDPALQVGADFGLPNGLYLGVFATNIKWIKDAGAKGSTEVDFYGGFKTEVAKGITGDLGVLRYQYLENTLGKVSGFVDANTTEIYGAVSYGPATLKYSHTTTNLFGTPNSKGSGYFDLSASFDMGDGWTVVPHFGRQTVANTSAGDFTDLLLGVTKDFAGILFGLSFVSVDAKDEKFYPTPGGKFAGKSGMVLSAKYNF